jgi:molybdopterin molybdotransferase
MGNEFLNIMNPEDVKKIISTLPFNKKVEKLAIENAYQRVLSENIYATINLPPFKRAAMDGYAVKAKDTFRASEDKPTSLKLLEVTMAGEVSQNKVEEGTCIEVSTGAPIPEGADAVIMIEFAEKKDEDILILDSVTLGANIAGEGSDVKKGELLLSEGEFITPDKIGVLSAIGLSKIPVYVKPQVAVISTGNEIIKLDEKMEYGKIYDINSYTLYNAVKSCGCQPIHSEIVKDDFESLKNKIIEFKDADIIITSGGTSAGAGDVLRMVLDEIGEVLVHGIAVKPGKPTIVGLIKDENEGQIIFGLPGYPVSALMIFHVFIAPFLRKISSLNGVDEENNTIKLKLSRRFRPARGRKQYVLVKIQENQAHPILKDSGAITALSEADGYFEVPRNVEILEEGSNVTVMPLYFK